VLAVAGALSLYGFVRERSIDVVEGGPRVLAVQTAIPQDMKGSNLSAADIARSAYNLSLEGAGEAAARGERVDLVVWPETTLLPTKWRVAYGNRGRPWPYDPLLPYAGPDVDPALRDWFAEIGAFTHGASSIAGALHAEDRASEVIEHNAAFLFGPDGRIAGRYDKMFPAPMSEYTPFYKTWPAAYRFLRSFVPPDFSQFEPGADVPVWDIAGWKIGASVCFDITFPSASNRAVRDGADAIVNVSNYGWFKDSSELDLALAQTVFRAIETRRGVVSVCNGGISCFVDPRGRVEVLEVPDEKTGKPRRKEVAGTLCRALTTSRARTLEVALGEWPGGLATALALGLAAFAVGRDRWRRRRAEEDAS
jgi:apolipoprotein N-acyltransferase